MARALRSSSNAGEAVFRGRGHANPIAGRRIDEFLKSQQPHVTYVSVSSSDIERVASVWYEEPHHRTVEQTMAELEELVEEPGAEGNLA